MMKKNVKQLLMAVFAMMLIFVPAVTADAAQIEDTAQTEDTEEREPTPLTFEIAIFTYEMLEDAAQEDMPRGFTIGDWEYNGVAVKAGFTENSDMICVMGEDWETGYQYRFIYDPAHEMFVPYFGADIKDGYIYTIPMYESAEIPYGFVDAYFVIQTVPMFTYMREDAELTQEEIAVGSLSEDNYLVFLMMDENGKEVHYTYDLIDRTFQRALLQKKDAEKVTELNETIDELSKDIGELNAINAERMNQRLTLIGILLAAVIVMAGVIVNLLMKISKMKQESDFSEQETDEKGDEDAFDAEYAEDDEEEDTAEDEIEEEDEDEEEDEELFVPQRKRRFRFFKQKRRYYDDEDEEEIEEPEEEVGEESETIQPMHVDAKKYYDDEIEILDLDLDDL